MQNYYVSTYFFSGQENQKRKQLKDEFIARYEWVILLKGYSSLFIDYELLNKFIKENKDTINSITLLDSDITLQDNFRNLVEEQLKTSDVIHGCSKTQEVKDGKILYEMPSMTKETEGFSGLSWTFSRHFLESIEWKFPQEFWLGGFDYLISKLYFQQKPEQFYKDILGPKYWFLFKEFYEQTKHFKAVNLDCVIIHNYHGQRNTRTLPLSIYSDSNVKEKEEIIKLRNKYVC